MILFLFSWLQLGVGLSNSLEKRNSLNPMWFSKLTHPLVYPLLAWSKLSMNMNIIANTAVLRLSYGLKRVMSGCGFHTDVAESEVIGVRLWPPQHVVGEDFHGNHLDRTLYHQVSPERERPWALNGPRANLGDGLGFFGLRRHPVTHEVFISQVNSLNPLIVTGN